VQQCCKFGEIFPRGLSDIALTDFGSHWRMSN